MLCSADPTEDLAVVFTDQVPGLQRAPHCQPLINSGLTERHCNDDAVSASGGRTTIVTLGRVTGPPVARWSDGGPTSDFSGPPQGPDVEVMDAHQ
jgi:hypothetical protein